LFPRSYHKSCEVYGASYISKKPKASKLQVVSNDILDDVHTHILLMIWTRDSRIYNHLMSNYNLIGFLKDATMKVRHESSDKSDWEINLFETVRTTSSESHFYSVSVGLQYAYNINVFPSIDQLSKSHPVRDLLMKLSEELLNRFKILKNKFIGLCDASSPCTEKSIIQRKIMNLVILSTNLIHTLAPPMRDIVICKLINFKFDLNEFCPKPHVVDNLLSSLVKDVLLYGDETTAIKHYHVDFGDKYIFRALGNYTSPHQFSRRLTISIWWSRDRKKKQIVRFISAFWIELTSARKSR